MRNKFLLQSTLLLLLLCGVQASRAQTFCPPNINFEYGNTSSWNFFIGSNNGSLGIGSLMSTTPLATRHVLTSGTATDYYGGFPIVDPVGGSYSLKLGNDAIGAQADQARYTFTVPNNVNNYSLIYRYAVVLEDPFHATSDQPFFRVRVYDSATGSVVNCASFMFVSQSSLPGFSTSSHNAQHSNGAVVYYKPWSTVSLNLSGQAGKTLVLEFTAADCALGAHMGYGYVDLSCGLFSISSSTCNATTPLSAPPGFQTYTWYNSNYTTVVGTGQSITVNTPSTLTQYHVVLTPYTGYGCTDTLHTQIMGSNLALTPMRDTSMCGNTSITLSPGVSGNVPPFTYSWSPATGLSCTSCANPVATPTATTTYYLTVTDSFGCVKRDTVVVAAGLNASTNTTNATCATTPNGSATVSASSGTPPYTYSWNTVPAQTTGTAINLGAGTYTVTVNDTRGCAVTKAVSITAPPALVASITSKDSISCFGSNDGRATAAANGGTSPYSYSWNTTPAQTGNIVTNLNTGTRIVTVTDANGCTDTESVAIVQPAPLHIALMQTPVLCNGDSSGSIAIIANGGTAGYVYAVDAGAFSSNNVFNWLSAGAHIVHLRDAHGCVKDTTINISQPARISIGLGLTNILCYGGASGSVMAAVTGGVSPYIYAVDAGGYGASNILSSLGAGLHTIHIKDANNCLKDTTFSITQPSKLNLTYTANQPLCNGGSNGSVTITGIGGTAPYTYAVNSGAFSSSGTISGLAAGTHTLHIMDANGCTKDSVITIGEPALLMLAPTITNALCNGGIGSVVVSASGGVPLFSYAIDASSFNANTIFNNIAAGAHMIHVRDANGCTKDSAINIAQPASLNINYSATLPSCSAAGNGAITISGSGGTSPYEYALNAGTFGTSSIFTNLSAGTYNLHLKDANGCTRDSTITITQAATISLNYTIAKPLCHGTANGSVTVTGTGGSSPYQYAVNNSSFGTAGTFNGLAAGSYIVHVKDANNCFIDSTITITQPSALNAIISKTNVSCNAGSNGAAQVTVAGGTSPYTYFWTGTSQTSASVSGLIAGTYSVTVTDAHGCNYISSLIITQPSALNATTNTSAPICNNTATGTGSVYVTGGSSPYTYSWNTSPVQTTATATALTSGSHFVTVTDSQGCTITANVTVANTPSIIVSVSPNQVSCNGGMDGSATASVLNGNGTLTYAWNTNPVQVGATAMNLGAGNYSVTVMNGHGCIGTGTTTIQEPPLLNATVTSQGSCPGVNHGSMTALVTGGTPGYTYRWNTTPVQTTASVAGLPTGKYLLKVTDAKGCMDTINAAIVAFPGPEIEAGANQEICRGASAQLNASGAQTYSWSPAGSLSCNNCVSPVASPEFNTTYTVVGTDANGCQASDTVQVAVVQHVPISVKQKQTICEGDSVQLIASGGVDLEWLSLAQVKSTKSPFVKPAVTTTFQVVITENQCFKDTLTQEIEVLPRPTVDLGSDLTAPIGSTIKLSADVKNAVSISWLPATGLSCADCFAPELQVRGKAAYVARVTNTLGCAATDTVRIQDICDEHSFFFPNVFTPNGDGSNDRFYPQGMATYTVQHLMIYNRWGEVVFSTNNIAVNDASAGWDGTFKGEQLKPDVYVYVMDAQCQNGQKVVMRGDITLIR